MKLHTPNKRQDSIRKTLTILRERFSESGALDLGTPFQMLVAVVLSARTKDEQVLLALPGLFAAFPDVGRMAYATPEEVAAYISRIGLYKNKAKFLVALAQELRDRFGGEVPRTLGELVTLPGVGRKTASVLVSARFATPAIAVDTHVFRIAQRLGWAKASTVSSLEQQLLRVVPSDVQGLVNTTMVPFGRAICVPGKPRCWMCPVKEFCAFSAKNEERPSDADAIIARADRQRATIAKLKAAVSL